MSEHWKSTPRYWCKHCSCYVRDTKLERQNHESTAKHQGALKRFLRDLHRGHEQEERDKERARREVARLNGVVTGGSSSTFSGPSTSSQQPTKPVAPSESQLKKQREQLLELGISMPDATPETAAPGEWTVTQTRVIEQKKEEDEEEKIKQRATGVRKREVTEEEKEEEEAVQGLFKKPRRWGRDSKVMAAEEDKELDALLSGSFAPVKTEPAIKEELNVGENQPGPEVKQEDQHVKTEPDDATQGLTASTDGPETAPEAAVKPENAEEGPAPVFFKKRKAKGIRQR